MIGVRVVAADAYEAPPGVCSPKRKITPSGCTGTRQPPHGAGAPRRDLVIAGQVLVSLRLTAESTCSSSTRCAICRSKWEKTVTIRRLLKASRLAGLQEVEQRLNKAYRDVLRSLHLIDRNDPIAEIVAKKNNRDRRDGRSRSGRDFHARRRAAWPRRTAVGLSQHGVLTQIFLVSPGYVPTRVPHPQRELLAWSCRFLCIGLCPARRARERHIVLQAERVRKLGAAQHSCRQAFEHRSYL